MFRILKIKHKLPAYTNQEILAKIRDLIHDKEDRRIMRLKLVDGMTLLEIAQASNLPYSTVRDHYYICKKLLFPPG